jgi:hypothetical protein
LFALYTYLTFHELLLNLLEFVLPEKLIKKTASPASQLTNVFKTLDRSNYRAWKWCCALYEGRTNGV